MDNEVALSQEERCMLFSRRNRIKTSGSARGRPRKSWVGKGACPQFTPDYGELCVVFRHRLGLTAASAADIVGISHVTILSIENGRTDRFGYRDKLVEYALKNEIFIGDV